MKYEGIGKYAMAMLLIQRGRDDDEVEAENMLREAIGCDRNLVIARYQMSLLLGKRGRYNEAIKELREITKECPRFREAYVYLAKLEALKEHRVLEIYPIYPNPNDVVKAHCLSAWILINIYGDMARAEDHLYEVLKIDRDNVEAHYNLGLLLFRRNDLVLAENEFRTIADRCVQARYMLAVVLISCGKVEEALEELLKIEPTETETGDKTLILASALVDAIRTMKDMN